MIQKEWVLFGKTDEIKAPATMGRLRLDKPIRYSIKCPNCRASWTAELSEETSVSKCFLCGETLSKPFGELLNIIRRLSTTLSETDDFALTIRDGFHKDEIVDIKISLLVELRCSACGATMEFPLENAPLLAKTVQTHCEFRCPNCQRRWADNLSRILHLLSDLKAGTEEKRRLGWLRLSNILTNKS